MKLYIVLQLADIEVIDLKVFKTEFESNKMFNQICTEESLIEVDKSEWSEYELDGTIRLAGDDGGSAQIIERELP